ncbi:MAG: BON domain-containing protein [Actinomycetota bacterium]|nr:BON domain-containing protein [Actinomycetota bacterium]
MSPRTTAVVAGLAALAGLLALLARRRPGAVAPHRAPSAPPEPEQATPATPDATPDDVTLTRRVETELFRSPEIPRGNVSVEARRGVVVLHGEVDSQGMKDDLAQLAGNVRGVRQVRNELELLPRARA